MVEQPIRKRRALSRVITAVVAVPVFLGAYVVSCPCLVYLDTSGVIEVDGAPEKVLELYYVPLVYYSDSDLPGGRALKQWIRVAADNGRERRRISAE